MSVSDWEHLLLVHQWLVVLMGTNLPASFFDLCDELSRLWLLPLGGVAISIFTGWVWGVRYAVAEMRQGMPEHLLDTNLGVLFAGLDRDGNYGNERRHSLLTLAMLWGITIRFIAPILVAVAFLSGIGWIRL